MSAIAQICELKIESLDRGYHCRKTAISDHSEPFRYHFGIALAVMGRRFALFCYI